MDAQMQSINRLVAEAERYVPVVQVSFHAEDKFYQIRGIAKGFEADYDPTDQLISVVTNKVLDAPAGTFTVSLAGDKWFMKDRKPILKSNDLVVIQMGYKAIRDTVSWIDGTSHTGSEDLDTVMIGLVDSVTRDRNGGGNNIAPSITTNIQGRDFGKLLIKAMLKFYPELGWDKEKEQKFFLTEQGWITLLKAFTNDNTIKGSPAKILDTIMRFILKPIMDIKWKVYDTSEASGAKTISLTNILRYRFAKTNFFIPFFMSAQQYEGAIWNLMDRVNLKPFTELFLDTRDRWEVSNDKGIPQLVNETCEESSDETKGKLEDTNGKWNYPPTQFGSKDGAQAVLVYRNTPFDRESWGKLRSHDLYDIDIIRENLSYSDNENYNLFWAGTTLTPFSTLDLKRVQPPLINEANIPRYGLNSLEVQIEGLELDISKESEQSIALAGLTKSLNEKLKDWFQYAIQYLSGSIETRGKGSYKIGQKLKHKTLGYDFYIEGVGQNFQVYGDWTTTLSVTRGAEPLAPVTTSAKVEPKSEGTAVVDTPTATPTKQAKYYTVQRGDTLWSIAKRKDIYNDGNKWTTIWEANKSMLIARDSRNAKDPGHWIYPGQKLLIP